MGMSESRVYWNDMAEKMYTTWQDYDISKKPVQPDFEAALMWLTSSSDTIVDFGCGLGIMALRSAILGAKRVVAVDVAEKLIEYGNVLSQKHDLGEKVLLQQGSIESLTQYASESFNGAILFNIIDNITSQETQTLLFEINRLLSVNSKLVIKFNPFTDYSVYKEKYTKIEPNTFQAENGLVIRYLTDDMIRQEITQYFEVESFIECEKHKQRIYFCKK